MPNDITKDFPASIPYGEMTRTHEEYDAEYWQIIRALYSGGKQLLKNPDILKKVFPRHRYEADEIYSERVKRAFYIPYPGEILDHIIAGLSAKPVQVSSVEQHDEFYNRFFDDITLEKGKRTSLNQLLKLQLLRALQCKRAWTLVDLPETSFLVDQIRNEADQRTLGALDAYAMPLEPEIVLDWEASPDGQLYWVKLCVEKREKSFTGLSDTVRVEYTIYRPGDWARYALEYKLEDGPPKEEAPVFLEAEGPHTFGRVPVLQLELPEGLWAMNKLESLAREYLNKRNHIAWAELRSLFPERYEFQQPEDMMCATSDISEDTTRFTNQTRGTGYTQTRAAGDRVEYVGPSPDPFRYALESLKDLRDEMHRVTHQMALSFDNSASALRRSGNSKAEDKKDSSIVLNALGSFAREHVVDIYTTVATGRGDDVMWVVTGMNDFESKDLLTTAEEAVKVAEVEIPSKTFNTHYMYAVAEAALRDEQPPEVLEEIRKEIEQNIEEKMERDIEAMKPTKVEVPVEQEEQEEKKQEETQEDEE